MSKFFNELQELIRSGDEFIESQGGAEFSAFAFRALKASTLSENYLRSELSRITLAPDFHTEQNYPGLEFSDLPLTVVRGKHCLIDIYVWRRRPTVINNHHFSGAFMCLEGKNVDLEFEYVPTRELTSLHSIGEIKLKEKLVLTSGGVSQIDPLDGYIHQNHHQADFTVNLCYRTNWMKGESLSNYLISGFKMTKDKELLRKTSRLMRFLDLGEVSLKELSLGLDEAFAFLYHAYGRSSGNPRFQEAKAYMESLVFESTGINFVAHLDEHDKYMEELEDDYE